jgi:hypothetical protein
MANYFNQKLPAPKILMVLVSAAVGVVPFLLFQMGYRGPILNRIGGFPGFPYYVIGYLSTLNIIDQILTVLYKHPYKEMPEGLRLKWKRMMLVLTVISAASIAGLIHIFLSGQ